MNHEFRTKQDAIEAGYRSVRRGIDKDVSGSNSYGYDFEDEEGNRTVTVWLTEEKNKMGNSPVFVPMFPPKLA